MSINIAMVSCLSHKKKGVFVSKFEASSHD
jgi:hypothetical protein